MLLAHSSRNGNPPQSYRDHVTGMVKNAGENIGAILSFVLQDKIEDYRAIIGVAAMYHDLGKLDQLNQEVLRGAQKANKLPVEHRDAGVKYLHDDCENKFAAALVYSHHRPGLPNMMEERLKANPFRYIDAKERTDAYITEYLRLHNEEFEGAELGSIRLSKLSSMEYRMLLSCLVDADYSDTSGESLVSPPLQWKQRLQRLKQYVNDLQATAPDTKRNQLRRQMFGWCESAPVSEPIEYCDSPVGTGKTTAIMAHMLQKAIAHNLRHIIIVLPFTNIISQTVDVLRKAMVLEGEDSFAIVAEHHHQADFENIELRHLASTWTAPIIVTTAVQFFETLASNIPSKLRKLHQLPGCGIVMDESHAALPTKLMPPAWKWITELTEQWGCHFCLCSGTSFKFWENLIFRNISSRMVTPILTSELSNELGEFENNRVYINVMTEQPPHFCSARELIHFIMKFPGPRLVVMDTIQSAAFLANIMRGEGYDVLHLSTVLTPSDRTRVLDEVKRRLDPRFGCNDNWTLIATSCVECGMDFSFHFGFCEMRSLQSCWQLSGRVSRNGEYEDGTLICFTITDAGFQRNPAFDIPRSVFRKQIDSGELTKQSITVAVTKGFNMECKESGGLSAEICKLDKQCAFLDVAAKFRVIEDDTITVIADQNLADKIRMGEYIAPIDLQKGSVNLRRSAIRSLCVGGAELPMLSPSQYDCFLGYMKTLV
ncbi:MAG TPA: CRISPR-associated endonuclease Cas3'' [Patescibacteria group bacterium]|nr:CRISPR-associated endonuclease Cas3'' [Patescibacteria group bacterium]